MMYETLAHYYDALVQEEEATIAWVNLIETYIPKGRILELACGSGEITIHLARDGYTMVASDISKDMIEVAKQKEDSELVSWRIMDMCKFEEEESYQGILCLCDSFNYILHKKQVSKLFQEVYQHLDMGGVFIMDMHSLDRLKEFEEEYNEIGQVGDEVEVQWTILSDEDRIYQNFAFYHPDGTTTLEQHTQRVYDPNWIKQELIKIGFKVEIFTDFNQKGIVVGEKQFYICRKEKECL